VAGLDHEARNWKRDMGCPHQPARAVAVGRWCGASGVYVGKKTDHERPRELRFPRVDPANTGRSSGNLPAAPSDNIFRLPTPWSIKTKGRRGPGLFMSPPTSPGSRERDPPRAGLIGEIDKDSTAARLARLPSPEGIIFGAHAANGPPGHFRFRLA